MRVQDVMTAEVATVRPAASLMEAARLLAERGVSGLPVVESGSVLGVFSERDLLLEEQELEARTVGEAMTRPAITIDARARIAKAARLMIGADVSRLPVLDHGVLVGIVTRTDVIRAFVRADDEIERDIREEVVHGLWLDDSAVQIDVHDGDVLVSGLGTTRFDEEVVRKVVARVPGVVSVNTHVELV